MKFQEDHGFTLMETILSIVIFGIISFIFIQIVGVGATVYEKIVSTKEIKDNLYLAQRWFNNEVFGIRDLQHILYADNTTFQFVTSDLDTIQYRYSAGEFRRSKNSEGEYTIAQFMTDSTRFYYYTSSDSVLAENPLSASSLLALWRVRLDIYAMKRNYTMKIESGFFPPNFKYGIVKGF